MDVPAKIRELEIIKGIIKKEKITHDFLEVGCGDGFTLKEFSKLGLRGSGIDVSEEAIEIAKKRNIKNVEIRRSSFENLKLGKYSLVFLLGVLEHVENDLDLLKKVNKIMPTGAHFFLTVPSHTSAYGFADINAGHFRRYDYKDLADKLKKAGFKIKMFRSVGFPVCNFYTWIFNFYCKILKKKGSLQEGKTISSGIEKNEGYYPKPLDKIIKFLYPVLSVIIRLDFMFLKTKLGNTYIIYAKKIKLCD